MNNTNVDVTIEYVNEIKCKVIASKEILYSLRNEYSFFVDGYKFNPKYKSGMWDGKIYMLDNKGLIYTGLLKSLLKISANDPPYSPLYKEGIYNGRK